MDPEAKNPKIPNCTQRHEDPTGISFYTPADSPYTDEDEDKGDNTITENEYYQDKTGMTFDSKIIWMFCKTNWSITY